MAERVRVDVTGVHALTWARFRAAAALLGVPLGVLLTDVLREWLERHAPE